MADYIYLLEHRLSPAQRNALRAVRELARSKNLTVFLVGGAVRDLTSGSPVRDLDVVVQGNALKLKKDLEKIDATIMGEIESAQSLFVSFPGSVRMEIGSTLSVTFPKPGKPIFKPSSILDDLRRRDFTANAMALSLNEGSYGLLMDPLNGVADIENRELRLVSNYGFIEDPIRMVRAARFMARLGWAMDERTAQRYATGKEEGYISSLTDLQRGYETEEIFHEEDPLRVIKRLEAEGWMKDLAPFWTSAKVDVAGLEHLRATQTLLQMQGIHPDAASANFPLLTAKLSHKEIATLKAGFVRQGFVHDIDTLEAKAKELATLLSSKAAALPSQTWKILTAAAPEAVLAVAYSTKSTALQTKFKNFTSVWPQARQKIPYTLMQEMRIVPELPGYDDLIEILFFELMDDKLQTPEEIKAFLEPYSPPAPPPPVNVRRPRAPKKDSKAAKGRAKKAIVVVAPDEDEDSEELTEELEEVLTEALDDGELPDEEPATPVDIDADEESGDDFDDEPLTKPSGKPSAKAAAKPAPKSPGKVTVKAPAKPPAKRPAKPAPAAASTKAPAKIHEKALLAKVTSASKAITQVKAAPSKKAPAKKAAAPSHPSHRPVTPAKGTKATSASKHPAKKIVAPAKKVVPKKAAKFVAPSKKAPAKKIVAKKVAAKKSVPAKKTPPAKKASKKSIPAKKRR